MDGALAWLPMPGPRQDQTWVDPIVGAKTQLKIVDNLFMRLMGDIGGFNASSTLTWQAMGALGYELASWASIGGGYRAIGYDHNVNGFKYDIITHGPFLGAEFKF
jgi:hypothetical protein